MLITIMQVVKECDQLRELIDVHDVVFLLTDSRESRWLPTVIATALGKVLFHFPLLL